MRENKSQAVPGRRRSTALDASAPTISAVDALGVRVAVHRRTRGLRVSELARRVGVSPSLISQIEHGQSRPSVATLFELAEALHVSVDSFFRDEQAQDARERRANGVGVGSPEVPPRHRADRHFVPRAARDALEIEGGIRWERLTAGPLRGLEFLELVYAPHAQSHEKLYCHPGTEMVLMLEGRLDIYVGFDRYRLEPGDSIHFASSFPHRYENPSDAAARAVTVILLDERESAPTITTTEEEA